MSAPARPTVLMALAGPLGEARTELDPIPREGRVPVGRAELYSRELGHGQPIVVLHGEPDFEQGYLVPDLDRLADSFRLIYCDQRGRGRSGKGVRAEDVTLESEMEDLDDVRSSPRHAPSTSLLPSPTPGWSR